MLRFLIGLGALFAAGRSKWLKVIPNQAART